MVSKEAYDMGKQTVCRLGNGKTNDRGNQVSEFAEHRSVIDNTLFRYELIKTALIRSPNDFLLSLIDANLEQMY